MAQHKNSECECGKCNEAVTSTDRFCPNCGSLFVDGVVCLNHGNVEAEGVCVICAKPFCKECGGSKLGTFLCDEHFEYEIQEGMARVYGNTDNIQAQFITQCLTQAGFHPFLYSRRFNPGADKVVITNVRNFGKYSIAELKVLVPYKEVLKAEKIVAEFEKA
jgi:hypothetical protein